MTSSAAPAPAELLLSLGSLGSHMKNWLANRISKVGLFRQPATACVNASTHQIARPRGMEMRWQNGTHWDSAGLGGTDFPGLGALTWATRNSRTRGGRNTDFAPREWRNSRSAPILMGRNRRSVKPSAQPTLVRTQHLPPPAKTARDRGILPSRGPSCAVSSSVIAGQETAPHHDGYGHMADGFGAGGAVRRTAPPAPLFIIPPW
jgi:hypothetical protein